MVSNESVGIVVSDKDNQNCAVTDYGGCNSFFKRQSKATGGYKKHIFFPIKKTISEQCVLLFATLLSKLCLSEAKQGYFNWNFRVVHFREEVKDDIVKTIKAKIGNDFSVLIVEIPNKDTGKGFSFLLYASFMRMFTQLAYDASVLNIGYPLVSIMSDKETGKNSWNMLKRVLNIAHSFPVNVIDRTPIVGNAITADGYSLFYTPFVCKPEVTFDMFITKYIKCENYRDTFKELMVGLILNPSILKEYQRNIMKATYKDSQDTLSSFLTENAVAVSLREKVFFSRSNVSHPCLVVISSYYNTGVTKSKIETSIEKELANHTEGGIVREGTRTELPRGALTSGLIYYAPNVINSKNKLVKFIITIPGRSNMCEFEVTRTLKKNVASSIKRDIDRWYGTSRPRFEVERSVNTMMRNLTGIDNDTGLNNNVLEHMKNEYTK